MANLEGFFSIATLFVILAAFLDICANLCVAASRGFRRIGYGIAAYILVGLAFYALYLAVKTMDLTTAYAMWGSFGIIGTCIGGWIMFRQAPGLLAWAGMALLICGMLLLH